MSLLNPTEVRDILRSSRIGTWRVEFGAHIQPRFYADAVMDELLGISGDISPQERFIFHRTRIHPDDPVFRRSTMKVPTFPHILISFL